MPKTQDFALDCERRIYGQMAHLVNTKSPDQPTPARLLPPPFATVSPEERIIVTQDRMHSCTH